MPVVSFLDFFVDLWLFLLRVILFLTEGEGVLSPLWGRMGKL